MTRTFRVLILSLFLVLQLFAEGGKPEDSKPVWNNLEFRCIGPFRGGRSAAVTGFPSNSMSFLFGSTGGGVWRTDNGGASWNCISDGFFGGSIGSIAISPSNENIIYVGGGEVTVRGNVSHGNGMWKSVDGGLTWNHVGLEDSRHITRIQVHPKNPDLVYAAVLGHLFGPNDERGVFRSRDGGKTWEKILFVNNEVGAVDLSMDPSNPQVLFASTWRVKRTPYSLDSGGEGSGLWKTTDGGETWKDLSESKGFPKGPLGIIGVSISASSPERIYAIVEAKEGGVFRSDNRGKTWSRVNQERKLRQRAWYYSRIYADPQDRDTVYVVNVRFWKSKDGGKSFSSISTPHGDHHDLWIDPNAPQRMIVGDDGGAQVTFNGGETWSTYYNQPTAQFYRVSTDNHFPYRIYAAQQDNSAIRILHRSSGSAIGESDWESTAGGESGFIVASPKDPDVVFGGSYGGLIVRLDHRTEQTRLIDVWPDNPMGHGAKDLKYRFQWNFPILFSPKDPDTLYAAANVLFRSKNEGQSWEPISGDLTRNDPSTLGSSGGPITKDNTSVEYYATIFAVAESPLEKGTIWTGSDDGKVFLTRDDGKTWNDVTPKKMPEWMQINSIETDPFHSGGVFLAGTRYKLDDFSPYLYYSKNYGQSWTLITKGIAKNDFTRVIRAYPGKQGVLFAGTESELYVSMNQGESWEPFQLNLPTVPITDLAIHNDDLIVATQGRSIWILDDLTLFKELSKNLDQQDAFLFQPRPAYRMRGRVSKNPGNRGTNAPNGVQVRFFLKDAPKEQEKAAEEGKLTPLQPNVTLSFFDADDNVIRSFALNESQKDQKEKRQLTVKKGLNEFIWNMRYPDASDFEGMIIWSGSMRGPVVPPGTYKVQLKVGEQEWNQPFKILKDPRSTATQDEFQQQFQFLKGTIAKLDEIHNTIKDIRQYKTQIDAFQKQIKGQTQYESIYKIGENLKKTLTEIEENLYQTKNKSPQDPLNFPIRLNDKLAGLLTVAGSGDFAPTDQAKTVQEELFKLVDKNLKSYQQLVEKDLPAFNRAIHDTNVPRISLKIE